MNDPIAYLFAGQGAQRVGMGRDMAEAHPTARDLFAEADDLLSMDLSAVMFQGPIETLTRTAYCQPALFVHGLACLRVLSERIPSLAPAALAGLSLGEFTAHAAAGTFSFADGLRLVAARGRFMDEACAESSGSMAAMIGGSDEAVRELAAACDVDVANLNAPGQVVLSGSTAGIARAVAAAKSHGIRAAKPLAVAGAYHSRLMDPARRKLAAELSRTPIDVPGSTVVANVTARPVSHPDDIRSTLESQVTGSVRWSESMQFIIESGCRRFIEFGPGGVLAGLLGRIDRSVTVVGVEDVTSIERAADTLSDGSR